MPVYNDITTTISPIARKRLSDDQIQTAVKEAFCRAEAEGWKPGQTMSLGFSVAGKGYSVAVNYLEDGTITAMVGLPQEVRKPHRKKED